MGPAADGARPGDRGGPVSPRERGGDVAAALLLMGAVAITVLASRFTERHVERAWVYAAAAALILVGRGLRLGRSVTTQHAVWAAIGLVIAIGADLAQLRPLGFIATVLVGFALVLPIGSRPDPELLPTIIPLVDTTVDDPLAPFVLHSQKSYFINDRGTAAIGYRTRWGIAVAGGDPVGHQADFAPLIEQFTVFCRRQGWRVAVLGAGENCRNLWAGRDSGLRSVAFGRDVVLDVQSFSLHGRTFRNLRQAVNRTRNAGVSTQVIAESGIDDQLRGELLDVATAADRGDHRRGFSMILDRLLTGELPGLWLVIARDATGRVVAFQRYATADGGREVSLDVPCRRPDAPNGTDERMTFDMMAWAKDRGAQHLSLSFAAFPELFDDPARNRWRQTLYRMVHLTDGLLEMESLYLFLRKFHTLGQRRFVLFRLRYFVPAVAAMLTLEFLPHRRAQRRSAAADHLR